MNLCLPFIRMLRRVPYYFDIGLGVNDASFMRFKLLPIILLLTAGSTSPAAVVFGNLGADGNGGTSGVVDVGGATSWDSHSFNTGTSTLQSLQSVTVGLDLATGGPSTVTMRLYSDSAGAPGSILATDANSVSSGPVQILTFDFNQALTANTTYWIAIGGVANLRWALGAAGEPAEQNSSGYSWQGGAYSADGGSNWTDYEPGWSENNGSISVGAVPEPSAAIFSTVGLLCLLRRRRG